VVTWKLAPEAPASTVTLAGTETAPELSDSATTAPPLGAAPLKDTVPVEELPPVMLPGLMLNPCSVGAAGGGGADAPTVIAVNWNWLSSAAESCTLVSALAKVVTGKVALVAPAGTVTPSGTLAVPGRLLARLTPTPPAGAALPSRTVPVAVVPPATLVGLTESDARAGKAGYSVSGTERVTPPPDTEIVTTVGPVTGWVTMLKKPMPLPAETDTVPGTAASAGLLLVT
jgi:hypothetical protein